ncbi:hypothetical protein ABTH88_18745, partial [Acinetobacter baumannii]
NEAEVFQLNRGREPDMPTKTMLQELKRLLLDTASGGSRQLTEVESDLVQTNILLGEAIGKLGLATLFVMEGGYAVEEIGINAVNVLQGCEGVHR